ncbi:MAG: thioesterase family protein [Candidatus Omnitrophota bacterium]
MKKRIYYHDTDAGGVVYYANYLKYMEEARTEFFEQRGIFIRELAASGTLFVVARQEIDYKLPAFYGDILDISTAITAVTTAKIEFSHETRNQNNQLVNTAKAVMVCVDTAIKPKAIPEELKKKLALVPQEVDRA